ncbi:hypothetical protein HN587_06535 [Candidatus Woesearchaeota archaeon]|nr:hypothetical protein [Candidatus Woesearchaeota archaeon]
MITRKKANMSIALVIALVLALVFVVIVLFIAKKGRGGVSDLGKCSTSAPNAQCLGPSQTSCPVGTIKKVTPCNDYSGNTDKKYDGICCAPEVSFG